MQVKISSLQTRLVGHVKAMAKPIHGSLGSIAARAVANDQLEASCLSYASKGTRGITACERMEANQRTACFLTKVSANCSHIDKTRSILCASSKQQAGRYGMAEGTC